MVLTGVGRSHMSPLIPPITLCLTVLIESCAGYDELSYETLYLELGLCPTVSAILALILLWCIYITYSKKQRLKKELIKSREAIEQLRKTISELKKIAEDLEKKAAIGVEEKKQIAEGIIKIGKMRESKSREEQMKTRYWENLDKALGTDGKTSGRDDELKKLENERKSIEEMIELTRTKYHRRLIDEDSFREITRDYQKQLIAIETKIRELEDKKQNIQ